MNCLSIPWLCHRNIFCDRPLLDVSKVIGHVIEASGVFLDICLSPDNDLTFNDKCCNIFQQIFIVWLLGIRRRLPRARIECESKVKCAERTANSGEEADCGQRIFIIRIHIGLIMDQLELTTVRYQRQMLRKASQISNMFDTASLIFSGLSEAMVALYRFV